MVQTFQNSLNVLAEAEQKLYRQALEQLRKKWVEKNHRPAVEHIDTELKKLEERKNEERRSNAVPEQKN